MFANQFGSIVRSQVTGSIVWGIASALEEKSVLDHNFGQSMTHSLTDYHVPTNASIHEIEDDFS